MNTTGGTALDPGMVNLRFASTVSLLDRLPYYDEHDARYFEINVNLLETTIRSLASVMTRRARVADQAPTTSP